VTVEAYFAHRDAIEAMLDRSFYPIEWVDGQVWTGAIQTRGDERAVIGFELKSYPGGAREIHGMFAAGDLDCILKLISDAEDFGRECGCTHATISSRAGWARLLAKRGYRPHQQTIIKELCHGA